MNIILTEEQLINNVFLTEERLSSLILEGRDPIELLKYKFQNIPTEIIESIVSIDPTKKKSMTQWVCKQWDSEKNTIIQALNNGKMEKLFQYSKDHPDVQLKNIPSVEEGIKMYVGETDDENADSVLGKSSEPYTYVKNLGEDVESSLANDFDIVYKDSDWVIAVPNTYEAACKLGEGMKWCTANAFGNGEDYYENYLNKGGKYYVNFDLSKGQPGVVNKLEYPYTRYQFHFESNQFMDSHDDPVDFDNIDLPDGAREFYEEEGYDLDEYGISDEEKLDRYLDRRFEDALYITHGLNLMQEWNDDYNFEEGNDRTEYYLYDDNDDRDPVTYDCDFYKRNDTIQYRNGDSSAIVLKTANDTYAIVYKGDTSHRRDWEIYEADLYTVHRYNDIIVGVSIDNYELFYEKGHGTYGSIQLGEHDYAKVFINPELGPYAELVTEEGFHTLVDLSFENDYNEPKIVIALDVPQNGEMFVADENNRIQGKYRTYTLDENESNEDYEQFQVVKKLDDNRVLVQFDKTDEYNIMDMQEHKYVVPFNFSSFNFDTKLGYSITRYKGDNDAEIAISYDGQQIGDEYMYIQVIQRPRFLLGKISKNGIPIVADFIDLEQKRVTLRCADIDTNFGLLGRNKNVCQALTSDKEKILVDFEKGERILPDYTDFAKIPYNMHFFAGKKYGGETYALFDYLTTQMVVDNVVTVKPSHYQGVPLIVLFGDYKYNLLFDNGSLALSQNVESINTNDNLSYRRMFEITNNENIYLYSCKQNDYVAFPNGINSQMLTRQVQYLGSLIELDTQKYEFYFRYDGTPHSCLDRTSGSKVEINQYASQETLQTLKELLNQDSAIKESIKKQFNDTLKKLWKTY